VEKSADQQGQPESEEEDEEEGSEIDVAGEESPPTKKASTHDAASAALTRTYVEEV
jgi:hypothetical protein